MSLLPQLKFMVPDAPIQGYIGHNGAGKSALMVDEGADIARRHGVPIYSNLTLNEDVLGVECRPINGLLDVMNISRAVVMWDDVASIAPARETNAAPPEIVNRLAQLRHHDALLLWSAPVLEDVDVKIRRVTQLVMSLKALRRRRAPDQLWKQTTLSYATAWDFTPIETVTINSETKKLNHGFVRLAGLRLDGYDTREDIELKADHAVCTTCGLRKRREYCRGNHPVESPNPSALDHQHARPDLLDPTDGLDHEHGTHDAPGHLIVNG